MRHSGSVSDFHCNGPGAFGSESSLLQCLTSSLGGFVVQPGRHTLKPPYRKWESSPWTRTSESSWPQSILPAAIRYCTSTPSLPVMSLRCANATVVPPLWAEMDGQTSPKGRPSKWKQTARCRLGTPSTSSYLFARAGGAFARKRHPHNHNMSAKLSPPVSSGVHLQACTRYAPQELRSRKGMTAASTNAGRGGDPGSTSCTQTHKRPQSQHTRNVPLTSWHVLLFRKCI